MNELQEMLRDFQNYILKGEKGIEKKIEGDKRMYVQERLAIYRNAYYLRLLEILECDFLIFKKYIGVERFKQLGNAYINAYPSKNISVLEFGEHFCDFLEKSCLLKVISPIQLELAKFEYTLEKVRVLTVPNHLSIESLREIPLENWAQLNFSLNASVQLFESYFDTPRIWEALSKDQPLSTKKKKKLKKWLIWGYEGQSFFCQLDDKASCFFQAFKSGKNFGAVCEALCEVMREEEVGEFAGRYLNQWIIDRIFVNYCCSNSA